MISFGIVHKHLTIEEVKFMTITHNVEINLYNIDTNSYHWTTRFN